MVEALLRLSWGEKDRESLVLPGNDGGDGDGGYMATAAAAVELVLWCVCSCSAGASSEMRDHHRCE